MRAGKLQVGAAISFSDPLVTDALGDSVDFFWIDLEHSGMSHEALYSHLLAARSRNKPGIVRVPGAGAAFIKPVLDAGADGIIIPMVRSAAEVQSIVDDCRYPPLGLRGYGPRVPSNYGRDGGSEYVRRANETLFVAVMIETAEALDAIDEIVCIKGLDSVALGPMDLSGSLGMLGEVDNPKVVSALERAAGAARKAGLFVGAGTGINPSFGARLAALGVQWLQFGGDFGYLIHAFDTLTRDLRRTGR